MINFSFYFNLKKATNKLSINPFTTHNITKFFHKDNTEKELKCHCDNVMKPTAYKIIHNPTTLLILFFSCWNHKCNSMNKLYIRHSFPSGELLAYDYNDDEIIPQYGVLLTVGTEQVRPSLGLNLAKMFFGYGLGTKPSKIDHK